jgi:hypothetical protein
MPIRKETLVLATVAAWEALGYVIPEQQPCPACGSGVGRYCEPVRSTDWLSNNGVHWERAARARIHSDKRVQELVRRAEDTDYE